MKFKIEKVYESNIKKAFKEQKQQMELKSSVGHEASCEDILSCRGCFRSEPDRIVSDRYVVERK